MLFPKSALLLLTAAAAAAAFPTDTTATPKIKVKAYTSSSACKGGASSKGSYGTSQACNAFKGPSGVVAYETVGQSGECYMYTFVDAACGTPTDKGGHLLQDNVCVAVDSKKGVTAKSFSFECE